MKDEFLDDLIRIAKKLNIVPHVRDKRNRKYLRPYFDLAVPPHIIEQFEFPAEYKNLKIAPDTSLENELMVSGPDQFFKLGYKNKSGWGIISVPGAWGNKND